MGKWIQDESTFWRRNNGQQVNRSHSSVVKFLKSKTDNNAYYSTDGIFRLREEEPGNWTLIDLRQQPKERALYGIDSFKHAIRIALYHDRT
jgi:hypothetical protein